MKIKIILISFIIFLSSLTLFGQSFTEIQRKTERYRTSETRFCEELNGAKCDYYEGTLYVLYLYEMGSKVFEIIFSSNIGQLCAACKDFGDNDLQNPEDFGADNPDDPDDQPYEQKCFFIEFYKSGNIKSLGVALCDAEPIVDCSYYGEYEKYGDFGKTEHYKFETDNNIVYETLLDERLNGTQVFLRKSTGLAEKINYYEQGDIKAQFLFREDNSIKSIVYEIEPADASSGCKYKSKYLKYAPNGTKVQSTTLSFNELPQ